MQRLYDKPLKLNHMKARIRVHGKSQSRTALGIINAYLKLHPDATPSEVQQAFPKSLNSRSPGENLIVPVKETAGFEKFYFEHEDEQVIFKNGARYALVEIWTKNDYDAICEHAKQYGICAAKEGTKPFEKGSYDLEFLDDSGAVIDEAEATKLKAAEIEAPEVKVKKKCRWWLWLLLVLLLLLLLLFLCKKCCCSDKCSTDCCATIENVDAVPLDKDLIDNDIDAGIDIEVSEIPSNNLISDNGASVSLTLPDGSVFNIAKDSPEFKLFSLLNSPDEVKDEWMSFDKIRFENGKTDPTPASDAHLKNIAMIMKFFPNSQVKIGGYTDNTGSDATNLRISAARAKVVADRLKALGVEAKQLTHEGYGSQNPICPANDTDECRATNRRVDVKVTRK